MPLDNENPVTELILYLLHVSECFAVKKNTFGCMCMGKEKQVVHSSKLKALQSGEMLSC